MAPKKTSPGVSKDVAARLEQAIRGLGDYSHVTVRAGRAHLNVHIGYEEPVARFTPIGAGRYRLSFHSHTGRWEPMPFMGDIAHIADALVSALGPFLVPDPDFSLTNSGSDH
jgi:hypothetical protein